MPLPIRLFQAASRADLKWRRRPLPQCDDSAPLPAKNVVSTAALATADAVVDMKVDRSEESSLSEDVRQWWCSGTAAERSSRRPASWGPTEAAHACCSCVYLVMLPRVRPDTCMHKRLCVEGAQKVGHTQLIRVPRILMLGAKIHWQVSPWSNGHAGNCDQGSGVTSQNRCQRQLGVTSPAVQHNISAC